MLTTIIRGRAGLVKLGFFLVFLIASEVHVFPLHSISIVGDKTLFFRNFFIFLTPQQSTCYDTRRYSKNTGVEVHKERILRDYYEI